MRLRWPFVIFSVVTLGVTSASAWWVKGHARIAEAAAGRLPDEMPAFFRAAGRQLGYLAGEPDRWKNPATKSLRGSEAPEHYIDLEEYAGHEIPTDRFKALDLLRKLNLTPEKGGLLPYALMEYHDRLAVAFYDYRKNLEETEKATGADQIQALETERKAIEGKCLVFAGILSHYTGDAAMPLHTTRDYDGRKLADGKIEQKGIHAKIDGFPEKFGLTAEEISRGVEVGATADLWKRILEVVRESHTHVEKCYQLDREGAFDRPTDASRAFILARCQLAAKFTGEIWFSAWKKSATLPPPY